MIEIDIPGFKSLQLAHLVLDYNGTLACDGTAFVGVRETITELSRELDVHVVTGNTFGKAHEQLAEIPCRISLLSNNAQHEAKLDYIRELGSDFTCAIGNGRNDRLMLKEAALGICVTHAEGVAVETLIAADVACRDIIDAFELLSNPLRLTATLRS